MDARLQADNTKKRFTEYLLAFSLFLLFGLLVNAGISVKGLYMDDLYLWSCYGEYPLHYYLFPTGGYRFRFMFNALAYPVLKLMGVHIGWTVPINIALNCLVALTVYHLAKQIGRNRVIGFFCGAAFLLSRFSYYQIGQLYGLLETFSLWGALAILYLIFLYVNSEKRGNNFFIAANILYFFTSFIHERYMVLAVLLVVAVFLRRTLRGSRDYRLLAWPTAVFALIMAIRYLAMGSLLPAGTGGSSVADSFSVARGFSYAVSQALYIFGVNAGPEHLNGIAWDAVPRLMKVLVFFGDVALGICAVCFIIAAIKDRGRRKEYVCNTILFLLFIAMCIGVSSVTIRVEMRWIYVSYTAALLFLAYFFRVCRESGRAIFWWCMSMTAVYFALLVPVELFYRSNFDNLYYRENQARYNSLAEVTYETYGDEIFDKTIVILENSFDMDEFTAATFWKPFNRRMSYPNPRVEFKDSIGDFGLVTNGMIVLSEDAEHDKYVDVTDFVRRQKCDVSYGYYDDNWMDQKAQLTIFTGTSGKIVFQCYYPGQLEGGEKMLIRKDDQEAIEVPITANTQVIEIPAKKSGQTKLQIEMNFYTKDAAEMRGETPLGMVVDITAD